jgi:hypothetical protein
VNIATQHSKHSKHYIRWSVLAISFLVLSGIIVNILSSSFLNSREPSINDYAQQELNELKEAESIPSVTSEEPQQINRTDQIIDTPPVSDLENLVTAAKRLTPPDNDQPLSQPEPKSAIVAKNVAVEDDSHDFDRSKLVVEYTPPTIIEPTPLVVSTSTTPTIISSSPILGFSAISNINQNQQNVATNQSFSVTFDSLPRAVILDQLTFYPQTTFRKTLSGNTLYVYPSRLERNTDYTFGYSFANFCQFDEAIECDAVTRPQASYSFRMNFRTDWKEKYTYGQSVQGRPLDSYIFDFGDKTGKVIMLTGGIHGSEWRSGDLTQLKNYLWNRPEELQGQNKTIIIVPFMNPDGTAMNIRYNAHAVNLNRNYPAYWSPCTQCGPAADSEPETNTWRRFAKAEKITHLISYHAQWPPVGIIFKGIDYDTPTDQFAIWVANRTGYPIGFFPGDSSTPAIDVVPGDQTVWASGQGILSIIIEATYISNSDWNKNFPMYQDLMRSY